MKFLDMLQMSANSLWKRKLRTVLTILGVVIGVASIVIMVSMGLGLSKSMMDEYQSYGSMTQVRVMEAGGWGYSDSDSSGSAKHLDDALISELENIEHVDSVYPVLNCNVIAIYGGYQANLTVQGMPIEALNELSVTVGEGTLPTADMSDLELFYGNTVIQDFSNIKTGKAYWETGVLPDVDLYTDPVFIVFDTNAYLSANSGNNNEGNTTPAPKKYLIPACGIEAGDGENYSAYSWMVYCDINKLEEQLKRTFRNKVIPGQPTTKTGKPYKQLFYSTLLVNVDDMDNVSAVQQTINDMGYNASSDAEWISSAQSSMGYVQAVLGGIGAVSLLVAAIGIANTMMMSIYERTREIGVMKVLGCDMSNIRLLFLLEAGMIGFVGGIAGLGLSYGVSAIINYVVAGGDGSLSSMFIVTQGAKISIIPLWLSALSIVFATLIAMIAGFFPSQKAMKLSPLAAIRND